SLTGESSYATFLPMVLICASDPPPRRVFAFDVHQPTKAPKRRGPDRCPATTIAGIFTTPSG
ncbi:hypothetical protein, partial [Mesorhizobium sp. M7A.F.Ca.AU.001.01.1.1]